MWTPEKIEKQNADKLSHVKPSLAEKCLKIIELAKAEKYTLLVTNGYRSNEEQDKLYQIGRRGIPGEKKVTNTKGGQSNHNSRDAVDFAFVVNGEVSWDEKLYQNIGRWAKIVGLNWGGNWKSFKDFPHVEI
ncbi:MAG TPA: M15 family metallopeptidase [Pyrinomonadaceae bacterium]|nr:M15 family metallopeptidase [Pyrinomonadaceae bacterium]